MNRRQISLPSAPKGRERFSGRAVIFMLPIFSIIRSCGSTPWLNIVPPPPPPPPPALCLAPNPFPSNFQRPSSFVAGRSTHTGVEVSHSPLSTFFWISPNSVSASDYTSLIAVVLQECRNTCTRLWIRSIKSSPKIGCPSGTSTFISFWRQLGSYLGVKIPRYSFSGIPLRFRWCLGINSFWRQLGSLLELSRGHLVINSV